MSLFGARAVSLLKELRSLAHLPQYNENAIREVIHEIHALCDALTAAVATQYSHLYNNTPLRACLARVFASI